MTTLNGTLIIIVLLLPLIEILNCFFSRLSCTGLYRWASSCPQGYASTDGLGTCVLSVAGVHTCQVYCRALPPPAYHLPSPV